MYQLRYREELPPAVVKELDDLIASYNRLLSTVFNSDGTINWPAALGIAQPKADEIYNPPASPLLAEFLEAAQAQGQQWKYGPWTLVDINGKKPNAAVRTVGMSSSSDPTTWNNFTVEGIEGCINLDLVPNHNAVITGIQMGDPTVRRIMVITNSTLTAGKTITLMHEDTGSTPQARFHFEDATDIELAVGQSCWFFYSPVLGRWTPVISGNESGGLVGTTQLNAAIAGVSSDFKIAYRRLTDAEIKAILTTPITIVAAQGANTWIDVIGCTTYLNRVGNYVNNPNGSLRLSGCATDITAAATFLQTSATPGIRMQHWPLNATVGTFDPNIDGSGINQPLKWRGGQDNTGGNAANFFDVFVTYRVITVIP